MSVKDFDAEFEQQKHYEESANDNDEAEEKVEAAAKAPTTIPPLLHTNSPPMTRKARNALPVALWVETRLTGQNLSPIKQKAPKLTKVATKAFIEFCTAFKN